jgi:hypothetical protein
MLKNAATGGSDPLLELMVAAHERDLQSKLDDMTPISELEQLVKNCSDTEFFVALTEEVRTAGAKTQKFLGKLGKTEENALRGKLDTLTANYCQNANEIAVIENRLKIKKDLLLRDKLKDIKIFECLNAEKATPLLLNIAKKTWGDDSLSGIKCDDGADFPKEEARNHYILNFYSNLYKVDNNVEGSIEDFLGPDIANHPTVVGSRLTDLEKASLDVPLDISELDNSLAEANLRSAPGIDGYSYRFINKFWRLFRFPLFRCAEVGLENNSLPDFFKTCRD